MRRGALGVVVSLGSGVVCVRRVVLLLTVAVTVLAGPVLLPTAALAADTGNTAPQTGKIVSDEPTKTTPNIIDGTVYSITQVGNMIVVGGSFTTVENPNSSTTFTRNHLLAFNATTGVISTTFAPDPNGTVYKVQAAADGSSVYVGGGFSSAGGAAHKNLFKVDVASGTIDSSFVPPNIDGQVRDLEVIGNRLWLAGKFTHLGGVAQKALGTLNATTGKYDGYFTGVLAGLHNPSVSGAVTDVLQISSNPQDTRLMAVGNFTTVDGQDRAQAVQIDISDPSHYALSGWSTNLYKSPCSSKFDTYMTDVEYSPDGSYFIVSTTGAYGGYTASMAGTSGCDGVMRFESGSSTLSRPTWTAYTGGDTTWTVEVTANVVYAGGHQRWENNPTAGDKAGQGAVDRPGIAALNPLNGMPYSWNPTRTRGVGVQDMMANSQGLYVGSDTTSFGHTAGNMYHADIAFVPLATGKQLPQLQPYTLPADVYTVASGGSQLVKRSFDGSTAGSGSNANTGPGWAASTGAFMVNGNLYKLGSDGTVTKQSFDGTNYGTASTVSTADALVFQTDWHTDVKTITSIFYNQGRIYFTKSGTNALYWRGFEPESDIVGQQRFSTTTTGINWANVRGAFVAGGRIYYADTTGKLFSATWDQSANAPVAGTSAQVVGAGTGWSSRAMFAFQGAPGPVNQPPVAAATVSCDKLVCTFDGTASSDPDGSIVSYDWDFGDGSPHATTATATHTYADAGDRTATLTVTDNRGATATVTKTASPTNTTDPVVFVGKTDANGNRTNHTVTVPSQVQAGDTLLLFFAANSTGPIYTGPSGWTQVQAQNGNSFVGRLYSRTATASDAGSTVTITGKHADGTTYYTKDDMTVVAYRGLDNPAITGSAEAVQDTATAVHQTPTVNATNGTSWLVSYWSDKSSSTTTWTPPDGQTQRSLGDATGTSHMSSLVTDSNQRVNSGVQGGLNATADSSASGLTMSVLLTGSGAAPPANNDPVAQAGTAECTNLTCTFDGQSSYDPDQGDTLSFDWNWGDGTAHGTSSTPSHTFATAGDKTVTLTVTDNHGASSVDTVVASPTSPPANQPPTARITNASCTSLACSFDGSTSSDPDNDSLTYDWAFGDGTAHSTTANPTHDYAVAGQYVVTLTVADGHGHTATDTATVNPTSQGTQADQPPVARITGVGCTGLQCSFSGSTSSDPDNDTLTYSWDFGDGTASSTATSPTHTYGSAGTYTVRLTVDDGRGNSDTASTSVSPSNQAPAGAVSFVGSNATAENRVNHTTALPSGVQVGDTLLAFFTANTTTPTYTAPSGWTLLETQDGSGILERVWTRTATAADAAAGADVTVTSSGYAKSDLTVVAYRGVGAVVATASKVDNSSGAAHVSPTVTADANGDWLITYWADKSGSTTAWTAPASQKVRQTDFGHLSGHIDALLTDSNGVVPAGPAGGLTATANSTSSRGASASILLAAS
jgi:PKD repeat protein